jgi:hypothetical protein
VTAEPALLTRLEAAQRLRLSPRSVDRLARRGVLRRIQPGGIARTYFAADAVAALLIPAAPAPRDADPEERRADA